MLATQWGGLFGVEQCLNFSILKEKNMFLFLIFILTKTACLLWRKTTELLVPTGSYNWKEKGLIWKVLACISSKNALGLTLEKLSWNVWNSRTDYYSVVSLMKKILICIIYFPYFVPVSNQLISCSCNLVISLMM